MGGVVPQWGLHGGCSPPGGLRGGGVGRGKKVPKKSRFFFGPNRPIIPVVHGFEKINFFISQKIFFEKKIIFSPTWGGVAPQGGLWGGSPPGGCMGGVVPFILGEKP